MSDASGTTVFSYDLRGLLISEDRTTGGSTYNTGYDYDLNGNLKQVRFPAIGSPSRRERVSYDYDDADRVRLVTAEVNGATTTVASGFAHEPFGPRSQMTFGNGLAEAHTFDNRYRLGTWTLGSLASYTNAYDGDGNLVGRIDNLQPANNRVFGYDAIHRLTSASGPWGSGDGCPGGATYTYDANGNRLCKGESGTPTAYTYPRGSNRLGGSTGGDVATYGYDANGNTTSDGTRTFQYSQADRRPRWISAAPQPTFTTATIGGRSRPWETRRPTSSTIRQASSCRSATRRREWGRTTSGSRTSRSRAWTGRRRS